MHSQYLHQGSRNSTQTDRAKINVLNPTYDLHPLQNLVAGFHLMLCKGAEMFSRNAANKQKYM